VNVRPHYVGVTGGIGSGKSTVAGFLGDLGGTVIDADAISRSLTATGGAALPAICAAFGPDALDSLGALDRAAMRERVFADPTARLRLEALVHPLIWQEVDLRRAAAHRAGAKFVVFDVPLLVEAPRWRPMLDTVVVVDCSPGTQHARVLARNGMDAAQTQRIIDAQAGREQRLACADRLLLNEGLSLAALQQQTAQTLHTLRL
jgi:dephospho-CoA kinase